MVIRACGDPHLDTTQLLPPQPFSQSVIACDHPIMNSDLPIIMIKGMGNVEYMGCIEHISDRT